jgi:hypothetical protein
MNWFREVAEQNLNQSAIALEALLKVARKLADDVGSQAFRAQGLRTDRLGDAIAFFDLSQERRTTCCATVTMPGAR